MKSFSTFISLLEFFSLFKYNIQGSIACDDYCNDCTFFFKCNSCKDHYFLESNACLKCDNNCKTCEESSSKCTSCYEGYYLS